MLLRRCAASCLIVLLCAAGAEAQQKVMLQWNAAANIPVKVDGYFVYQDGKNQVPVLTFTRGPRFDPPTRSHSSTTSAAQPEGNS